MARLIGSQKYNRVVSVDIGEPRSRISGVEYSRADVRDPLDPALANGLPADILTP